jgi:hypothetical protein
MKYFLKHLTLFCILSQAILWVKGGHDIVGTVAQLEILKHPEGILNLIPRQQNHLSFKFIE